MKSRSVIVTMELETELSLKDVKTEVKDAVNGNCWQTTIKQIQVNIVDKTKK